MSGKWKNCIHWSAGSYRHGADEHLYYHQTIDNHGIIRMGLYKPEQNIPPLYGKPYAAHCGGGNSWTIGTALLGMAGFKSAKNPGRYPLTPKQCEAAWKQCAWNSKRYNIPIELEWMFTHYEFGKAHPNTSSRGKIDIIHLPYQPHLKADEVGDFIRDKITWYRSKL